MIGSFLVLLSGSAVALGDVSIPVVGQPSPFYGAAGKDVKVETSASPIELTIDDSIIFTIRVSKLLNSADVVRPDLTAIDEFRHEFQIQDEATIEPEPNGTRIFRYRLRPRSSTVKSIPGFVFPYYDPNLPQPADRPEFPFRKARTEPIAIGIVKAAPPPEKIVPLDVPAFAETLAEPTPGMPGWAWWVIAAGPPLIAVGWCAVWRVMNPVGDRLARRRRSRAARVALRTLHSLARHSPAEAAAVVSCVAIYLAERFDLPGIFRTPSDLAYHLRNASASNETIAECVEFLRDADAVRFAPSPAVSAELLIADAERLIRRQEGEG
jgi:hypothetical protein